MAEKSTGKPEQAKTQASKDRRTTPLPKETEDAGQAPRRRSSAAVLLLIGALIVFGGLIVGGVVGYTLGRLQARVEASAGERAFLGVGVLYIEEGALIHDLHPNGPADEAGLLVGDIIVRVDGQPVGSGSPLEEVLSNYRPGDEVSVAIIRGGERETFDVTLGETPADLGPRPVPVPRRLEFVPGPLGPEEIAEPTPFLGVVAGREQERGVLIEQVLPGSPASSAGLRDGDVILSVDGESVDTVEELQERVLGAGVGGHLELEVRRDGERREMVAVVGTQFLPMPPGFEAEGAYLGVTIETFTRELADELELSYESGVLVLGVEPDSPAARVGLRERDVILRADDQRVRDMDEFIEIVHAHQPGDVLELILLREGEERNFEVALGARPMMPPDMR